MRKVENKIKRLQKNYCVEQAKYGERVNHTSRTKKGTNETTGKNIKNITTCKSLTLNRVELCSIFNSMFHFHLSLGFERL